MKNLKITQIICSFMKVSIFESFSLIYPIHAAESLIRYHNMSSTTTIPKNFQEEENNSQLLIVIIVIVVVLLILSIVFYLWYRKRSKVQLQPVEENEVITTRLSLLGKQYQPDLLQLEAQVHKMFQLCILIWEILGIPIQTYDNNFRYFALS